jgi:hypothetical protein
MPFVTALRAKRWLTAALLARLWPAPKSAVGTVNGATPPMVTIANVLVRSLQQKLAQLGHNIVISGISESGEIEELEKQLGSLLHEETKAKEALNNVVKAIEAGHEIQALVIRARELESKLQTILEQRLLIQKRLGLLRAERSLAEREKLNVHQLIERLRDPASRLKLREEIRSKVEKVDLFPRGLTQTTISEVSDFLKLLAEAGRASKLANLGATPAFLVSFKSGERRLVVRLIDVSSDLLMVLDPDKEVSSMILAERATNKEIVIG